MEKWPEQKSCNCGCTSGATSVALPSEWRTPRGPSTCPVVVLNCHRVCPCLQPSSSAFHNNMTHLTTLTLVIARPCGPGLDPPLVFDDLLATLGQLPSLQNLKLQLSSFLDAQASTVLRQIGHAPVQLSTLQALTLVVLDNSVAWVAEELIKRLDFPMIRSLDLSLRSDDATRRHLDPELDMMLCAPRAFYDHRKPLIHLQSLFLSRMAKWNDTDNRDHFERLHNSKSDQYLLSLAPNLQELTLEYLIPKSTVALLGASPAEWPGALRHLHTINVYFSLVPLSFAGEQLLNIALRRFKHSELKTLKKVKFVGCHALSPMVLRDLTRATSTYGSVEAVNCGMEKCNPKEIEGIIVKKSEPPTGQQPRL